MDANALKMPFQATILATVAGLRELRTILLSEQEALLDNEAGALEQIVRDKADCLQQLEHSVQAREQMLQQLRLPAGLPGAEQFVSTHFSPAELLADWQSLVTLSREVSDLNSHNGKLARAREKTTREALGILTGRPQSSGTYSRKGVQLHGLAGCDRGKC